MLTMVVDVSLVYCYIDGSLQHTFSKGTNCSNDGDWNAYIGRSRNPLKWFDGKIDDLAIYDFALDLSQIDSLHNQFVPVENIKYNNNISIYPNPSSGIAKIKGGISDGMKYSIYDIKGNLVEENKIFNNSIGFLPGKKGLFLIQIRDKQGEFVFSDKLILQ